MASSISTLAVLLLLYLLSLAKSARAQVQGNIDLGSSLTVHDRNQSWTSPSGDFAFGFRRVQDGSFLLAVWFNKIPEKTIIWWAKPDVLAPDGSKLELTEKGLNLTLPSGITIWPREQVNGVFHASMLDTGNLVLKDEAGSTLWETFRDPSDTIMPTQVLKQRTDIVSRSSNTSYSSGRFRLSWQADGNLVMYTIPFIDTTNVYWSTFTVGRGHQVIFDQTGQIYLTDESGVNIYNIMSSTVLSEECYQRAVIDYDGVFRQYVHPKKEGSCLGRIMGWTTVSFPVPSNICTSMRQLIGQGACGFNSYCILGDNQRPRCECPPGYSYVDPSNEMNGCKRDFLPQSCETGSKDSNLFAIEERINANWPYNDYDRFQTRNLDLCRQACLTDCYCDVAILGLGYCWKKRMPLSNGVVHDSVPGKALIKVRIQNSTESTCSNSDDRKVLIIVGSVLLGCSVFVIFILMSVIGHGFYLISQKKQGGVFNDDSTASIALMTSVDESDIPSSQPSGSRAFSRSSSM